MDRIYYTPEEMAKRFRLSLSTIYNLIDKGELPSIRIGKCYRIPHGELQRHLELQRKNTSVQSDNRLPRAAKEFVERMIGSSIEDNIVSIILYGSHARGDFGSDSDIDILIVVDELTGKISDEIAKSSDEAMAATDYDDFLSVIQLSEKQWLQAKRSSTPFYKQITQEGVALWKRQ